MQLKLFVVVAFAVFAVASCVKPENKPYVIAENKTYETSLFRQHCSICHGPEANGRALGNGAWVPSLREGQFKFVTEAAIQQQIVNGGNGMPPFGKILTDREVKMMTTFVYRDLRGNK